MSEKRQGKSDKALGMSEKRQGRSGKGQGMSEKRQGRTGKGQGMLEERQGRSGKGTGKVREPLRAAQCTMWPLKLCLMQYNKDKNNRLFPFHVITNATMISCKVCNTREVSPRGGSMLVSGRVSLPSLTFPVYTPTSPLPSLTFPVYTPTSPLLP